MPHTVLRTVMHDPLAHLSAYIVSLAIAISSIWLHWILIPLAVLVVIIVELVRRSESLVFYDDGVAREFQLISKNKSFLEYDDIQEFNITQSLIERILGLGTIRMQTAGEDAAEIVFDGIKNPDVVEQLMHDCLGSVNKNVKNKDVKEDVAPPAGQATSAGSTP